MIWVLASQLFKASSRLKLNWLLQISYHTKWTCPPGNKDRIWKWRPKGNFLFPKNSSPGSMFGFERSQSLYTYFLPNAQEFPLSWLFRHLQLLTTNQIPPSPCVAENHAMSNVHTLHAAKSPDPTVSQAKWKSLRPPRRPRQLLIDWWGWWGFVMGPVVKDFGMFVQIQKFKSWGGKNIKCWGFEWISGLIAIALKVLKSQERGLSRRWTSEHLLHVLILVILILSVITRIIHPEFYQHLVMSCPNSHSIFLWEFYLTFLVRCHHGIHFQNTFTFLHLPTKSAFICPLGTPISNGSLLQLGGNKPKSTLLNPSSSYLSGWIPKNDKRGP